MDKMRDNISTLRILQMTRRLDLSEEQAAKIYPFITRIEKEKGEIFKKIGQEIGVLRNLLKEAAPGDEEILKEYNAIKSLRNQIGQKEDELEAFLEDVLTPVQKAKYMLFTVDFFRGLRENLDRAKRGWRQQPPPRDRKE